LVGDVGFRKQDQSAACGHKPSSAAHQTGRSSLKRASSLGGCPTSGWRDKASVGAVTVTGQ